MLMGKNISTQFQCPPPLYLELLEYKLRHLEKWNPSKQSCQVNLEVVSKQWPARFSEHPKGEEASFLSQCYKALPPLESWYCEVFVLANHNPLPIQSHSRPNSCITHTFSDIFRPSYLIKVINFKWLISFHCIYTYIEIPIYCKSISM